MHLGPLTYIHTLACPYTHVLVGQNAGETGSGACCDLRLATIINSSCHIISIQRKREMDDEGTAQRVGNLCSGATCTCQRSSVQAAASTVRWK
jgi:hypothetical protein